MTTYESQCQSLVASVAQLEYSELPIEAQILVTEARKLCRERAKAIAAHEVENDTAILEGLLDGKCAACGVITGWYYSKIRNQQVKKVCYHDKPNGIQCSNSGKIAFPVKMLKTTPRAHCYLLDGKPVPWTHLIREAEKYGYGVNQDILITSEATKVLRKNGHEVGTVRD